MDPSRAADDPAESRLRAAARAVLDGDGRDHLLQPWQVAYLVDVSEGRPGVVPPGCGVGRGWLQERLDEAAPAAEAAGGGLDTPRRV